MIIELFKKSNPDAINKTCPDCCKQFVNVYNFKAHIEKNRCKGEQVLQLNLPSMEAFKSMNRVNKKSKTKNKVVACWTELRV